ncbi:hypothetical protein SAMN05216481_1183, partial [Streptomyces radiopugnans]
MIGRRIGVMTGVSGPVVRAGTTTVVTVVVSVGMTVRRSAGTTGSRGVATGVRT